MLTAAQIYAAAQRAGMTVTASWTPGAGPTQTGQVNFISPDQDLLRGDVLSREYSIEYPSTQFTGLAAGDTITVDGQNYEVRSEPEHRDSGAFTVARLTKTGL